MFNKEYNMKKNIRGISKGFIVLLSCISMLSCKKTFDIAPGNALASEDAYRNVYDADAAVIGIYGKFARLAKQYIVLNELRADLMDVTSNADQYLKQINLHTETADNPYADPKPFYSIIIDCNDALANFDKMLQDNRLTKEEYDQRYSDIGALRCWLYLQVGIHWGTVPYVTDPIANIDDVKDESKFPRLSFDQLLTQILSFAEALPYKGQYPTGTSLVNTTDGYSMDKVFIVKKLLLGDLNLWKGNWTEAAKYYQDRMNYGSNSGKWSGGEEYYEYNNITWQLNRGDWVDMFRGSYSERYQNYENIWMLPFDKNFPPLNPFIDMFSTSGSYLLKPSAKAIKNWTEETSATNTLVGDAYRSSGSYNTFGGKPQITKLLVEYNPSDPFETGGRWSLYRAAKMHLRYAEAANRAGRNRLAYAILNRGVQRLFDAPNHGADVTYIQQSDTDPNSPFYFDGRQGDYPSYRGVWYRQEGIRTRVGLAEFPIDSALYFDTTKPEFTITRNSKGTVTRVDYNQPTNQDAFNVFLEDKIIKEAAEELAFEGNRWQDLLRIALRRKATDPNYLANKVAAKFDAANDMATADAVRTRLSNEANWYLPFKWK